jgi:hypothetical protein
VILRISDAIQEEVACSYYILGMSPTCEMRRTSCLELKVSLNKAGVEVGGDAQLGSP